MAPSCAVLPLACRARVCKSDGLSEYQRGRSGAAIGRFGMVHQGRGGGACGLRRHGRIDLSEKRAGLGPSVASVADARRGV